MWNRKKVNILNAKKGYFFENKIDNKISNNISVMCAKAIEGGFNNDSIMLTS